MALLAVSLAAAVHAMVANTNPEWNDRGLQSIPIERTRTGNSSVAHDADGLGQGASIRVAGALTVGYYSFSWTRGSSGPSGINLGIAFSGWGTVGAALQAGPAAYTLSGRTKYLSLGGGNGHGLLSTQMLRDFASSIPAIMNAGFNGVCFDVERSHHESEMIPAMQAAFASCKTAGLRVMVTTSHSAPVVYDSPPGALVASWMASPHIDHLSPQLYTTGKETSAQFDTASGVAWSSWRGARAIILPSLVDGSHYASTKAFFSSEGISIGGYVQWKGG